MRTPARYKLTVLLLLVVLCSACSVAPAAMQPTQKTTYKRRHPMLTAKLNRQAVQATKLPPIMLRDVPEVRYFLRVYTSHGRRAVSEALTRRENHLALVEETFAAYGLPGELTNVAMVESWYIEDAVSSQGAAGVWQFMRPTAESYGLRCSILRDERYDVELATDAAARYLLDLYNRFGEWTLALAAYNAGQGRLERAMAQAGTNDVFKLAQSGALPKETGNFVAKFMAITLLVRHLDVYGFEEEHQRLLVMRQSGAGR